MAYVSFVKSDNWPKFHSDIKVFPEVTRNFICEVLTRNMLVRMYLLKVNNRNTRTRCERCSNLKIKTPEYCHWRWRCSCVFIVNLEHISHFGPVFLLSTLNM